MQSNTSAFRDHQPLLKNSDHQEYESTNKNQVGISNDEKYVTSLVVRRFDQRSIPKKRKGLHCSEEDKDPLIDDHVRKEACFELPVEFTENGFELLRDAEVTMYTSMPPSREFL